MKKLILIIIVVFLTTCSLNNDSKFSIENNKKNKDYNEQLNKIMVKSNDIISMNFYEYEIYLEEYSKRSKYPDIK